MNRKDNSGNLFKNDRKKSENHPDYRGSCTIGGVEYFVAGWKKEGNTGTYLSLSFQTKEESEARRGTKKPAPQSADEDIPF